nr:MAG TPA: hypothetical protein [Caudoviricetes sp.]
MFRRGIKIKYPKRLHDVSAFFIPERSEKVKYCPFNLKVIQQNQTRYEYGDNGNVAQDTHILTEIQKMMECKGKQCACWRFGRCRRRK